MVVTAAGAVAVATGFAILFIAAAVVVAVCTGAEIRLVETVSVGDVTVVTATNSNLVVGVGVVVATLAAVTAEGGDMVNVASAVCFDASAVCLSRSRFCCSSFSFFLRKSSALASRLPIGSLAGGEGNGCCGFCCC